MTEAFGGKQWVVAQPKPSNALAVLISSNKHQPTTTEVVLLQSPRRCSAKRTMGRSSTAVLIPDTQVIFETSTCNGGGNDNNNKNNNRNNNGGGSNNGNFHRWNNQHNNENNNNQDGEGWYYYSSSSSYLYDTLLIPPVTKSAALGAIQRGISYENNNSHRFLLPLLLQQWLQGQCYLVIATGKYLLQMYKFHLESNPLVTKSVTSGLMGVMGDVLAQYVEHVRHEISARKAGGGGITSNSHSSNDSSLARGGISSSESPLLLNRGGGGRRKKANSFHFNSRRSLAILLDGLLISGPLMHLAYNAFEYLLPVAGVANAATTSSNTWSSSTSSGLNAMIHVLADSILLDGIFVASAMASSGLLEGYSLQREIIPQLQKDYIPAIRASLATSSLMAPIQYACFRYLPLSCRVFAMNVTDIIWDAVISFMSHRSRTDGTGHLIHK